MNNVPTFPVCKHSMAVGEVWMGQSKTTLTCNFCELERLTERVAELEDTIRLYRADGWNHSSCGRDDVANRMLDGIESRRGPAWTGADVSNEPATGT